MSRHSLAFTVVIGVLTMVGCAQKAPPAPPKPFPDRATSPPRAPDDDSKKQAEEAHRKAVKALEALKVHIQPAFTGGGNWLRLEATELKENGTFKPEVLNQLKKLNEPLDLRIYEAPISDDGLAQLKDIPALSMLVLNKNNTVTDAGLRNLAGCAGLTDIELVNLKVTDAGFAGLSKTSQLKRVSIFQVPLGDAGLEHLKALQELQSLTVDGADNISAAGVANLKKLPRLKKLQLQTFRKDSKLNDAALKEIGEMETLETLILGVQVPTSFSSRVTAFGDDGVAHLGKLKALKELNLGCCDRVTDAGLASLKGLDNLETLVIGFTKTSDDGVANLKELTKLKRLTLNGLKLTQKGLAQLGGLSKLEWLDLRETGEGVNDAALVQLKGLSSLKDLILYDTSVTKKGADELKKTLPELDIRLSMR
jgi:Leucine-rich repeat (LRR) protein